MKSRIAIALVGLSLLLAGRVWHDRAGYVPAPEASAAETDSPPVSENSRALRVKQRGYRPTLLDELDSSARVEANDADIDPDSDDDPSDRIEEFIQDVDIPATLEAFAKDDSAEGVELRQLLVRRWAESEASSAAAWASQCPEGTMRSAMLEQVAIAWANTDLAAAASWVRSLPQGGGQQAALFGVAYEAARTIPVAALDLAVALPPTRERDDLLEHAVSQWTETDADLAAAWVSAVPDPSLRQRLTSAVAIVLSEQDVVAAVTLAVNSLDAGDEQDRAVVSIVQRWAQYSPEAAASWVTQFPDIPSRDPAVQNLLTLWTAQDAEAAGRWLHELPAGTMRDAGIVAYAQALADRDRTAALSEPAGEK